jgi:signal transduction histidine kinase
MKSFLGVPIVSKGQVIGNLYLTDKLSPTRGGGSEEFTQEDEDGVVMLAAQAAVAVENARLYQQVQALAVLEERERIAHDLHDGIIQSIYAVGLGLEQCTLGEHLDPIACRAQVERAIDDLNGVIQDVRSYIMGLEPRQTQGRGLRQGLEALARDLLAASSVQATIIIEGQVESLLTSAQSSQLCQVTREALANVLKHARATAVELMLAHVGGDLVLSIRDDGAGFDPAAPTRPEQHGLRNIAERARELGGELRVESAPGAGTTLRVRVPVGAGHGALTPALSLRGAG